MKKIFVIFMGIIFSFLLGGACGLYAEGENPSGMNWSDRLSADRQKIESERKEAKENARQARAEEKELRQQIKDVRAAGDKEKARELKTQLKSIHHKNIQKMKQDKKDIHDARKELRQDRRTMRDSLTPARHHKIK